MPPNVSFKGAFVRGKFENLDQNECTEKETIRTDFILRNAFSRALKNRHKFETMCAMNKKEEHVMKEIEELIDGFQRNFGDSVRSLCSDVEVTEDTVGPVLLGVSNELFCEGIKWSRFIALFVFVGELTLLCLSRKFPESIVDVIYECFCRLMKEKLKGWIDDHGGWEGLTTLTVTKQENTNTESPTTSNISWGKSLLYSTVRMVGTLAHIANSSGHAFP